MSRAKVGVKANWRRSPNKKGVPYGRKATRNYALKSAAQKRRQT